MYAYCRNSPVFRIDIVGTVDACCKDEDGEILSSNELEARGKDGGGRPSSSITTLYRSVGRNEAQNIKSTGQFNLSPKGMASKQFAFSYDEAVKFGKFVRQDIIVSAQIPTDAISQFDRTGVDRVIFRHGTLTVHGEMLGVFNELSKGTIYFVCRGD